MLDQSFSYENLKEIYDIEKRKGYSLDEMLICAAKVAKINTEIKDVYKEIKNKKLGFSKKISEKRKIILNQEIDALEENLSKIKESKKVLIKEEFESISNEINSSEFSIKIKKVNNFINNKKPLYSIQDGIKGFLFKKHIQRQLNKLYKIKQSNRYLIVNQICDILKPQTPLFNVIKIDIKNFYESINISSLESKLVLDDNLLSPKIKKHISDILGQYKKLSGFHNGVPRGIGLSAYLGELYMREFDRSMKKNEQIFFYARYVDDIIIITAKDTPLKLDLLVQELADINLKLNISKTFNLRDTSSKLCSFDYLGYSFTFNKKNTPQEELVVDISEKRFLRYKEKIDLAFNSYQKTLNYGRKAAKYLFLRIKFLVSNVRLVGEKDNIVSGIYYSNRLIDFPSTKLDSLDVYLNSKINTIKSISLSQKLRTLGFAISFSATNRKFFYLKKNKVGKNKESKEMKQILKIWNYVK